MIINNEARMYHLFPQVVIASCIDREFSAEELGFVDQCANDVGRNTHNLQSKNTSVLAAPEMASIKEFIDYNLKLYVKNIIMPVEPIDLYITQSWINYTLPNCGHHKHFHANSIISGVFYINAIAGEDKIKFYKETLQQIKINTYAPTLYNSEMCDIEVESGTLLLFNSLLQHSVDAISSDRTETRISLSFNTFAKGIFGSEHELTLLEL
jgi:uncharacterized protein (TIGR02466 family)